MNAEFMQAFEQLGKEKGIAPEILFDAIEAALISAYKRNFSSAQNVRVSLDRDSGEIHVYARKTVVAEAKDPRLEISLEEARSIDRRYDLEDVVETEVTPKNFGRQTGSCPTNPGSGARHHLRGIFQPRK
jgi:transcription termination/antitermination protein NusA